VDLAVALRAELGEPLRRAGVEVVALDRQVDRQVLADDGRRRGEDPSRLANLPATRRHRP
jgi:hypothetical protein